MTITLTVSGKIASVDATAHVVAGNTYPVALSLDSEWTGSLYLRVRFGSLYYDIPFASTDASVDVQMPVGYPEVGIGVFSEALEICSCEARIRLLRSILEAGEQVVEFDSDLYDQWAGEVTTLLTDDAFDAESTRPVQNAVLTAWKNTVPLDSALVHKTGNETIAGAKTFTSLLTASNVQVKDASTPTVTMLKGSTEVANLASDGTQAGITASSQFFGLRGLGTAPFGQSPSYTADQSADTKIVTRAMLATTPTVVHTTGAEAIAGNKTFTSPIEVMATQGNIVLHSINSTGWFSQIQVKDSSNALISAIISSKETGGFNRLDLRTYVSGGTSSQYGRLMIDRYSDHTLVMTDPYYPADSGSNPQPLTTTALMTSGNIAVDPRIVHTTGNETIAGLKTFSGTTNFDARVNIKNATIANDTHWFRLYEISPHSNSGNIEFIVRKRTGASLPARFQLYCGGIGSTTLAFQVETNPMLVQCVAARRASDNHIEIWGKTSWSDWQIPFYYRHGMVVSDYQTADEPPAIGDTYNLIATL